MKNNTQTEPDNKECMTCGTTKESNPTPDGDEICPSCGDREMMDLEED
jgi:rubrerythrin